MTGQEDYINVVLMRFCIVVHPLKILFKSRDSFVFT
eukprot:CAMPEP_0113386492 /NCGR_PEP_ID=MMETSP0013_2-20120614/8040_1 /TAXON_ID=2843 ORGANISM="Skeletonema costatum, Strain 1716" /NCGR_SAMPLE_ID=MMETSP0013_2 /ASSEMBLY_ACC=CAM_ASM_000158 /LENGTH=35 /DNA_ID=CAMNT_0000269341 /DNA_START=154 /DNA_END=257 /DNA_ORIENTATION=- /assembly_acc=CAM_ASM_000158